MLPHGVMFHHFHDGVSHPRVQGSIDGQEFGRILDDLRSLNVLSPDEWMARSASGRLRGDDVCITLDDGLRSQFDIALPVLESKGLQAFFAFYSAPLEGVADRFEIYRWVRTVCFDGVDAFYSHFLMVTEAAGFGELARRGWRAMPENYLSAFAFYTDSDRRFRFLRDEVLGPERYQQIMEGIVSSLALDEAALGRHLWMSKAQVRELADRGHAISLHSHTHPTRIDRLPPEEQEREYGVNFEILSSVSGTLPRSVAHPCGTYSEETLRILRGLGAVCGFRSSMTGGNQSAMELMRRDHADLRTVASESLLTLERPE